MYLPAIRPFVSLTSVEKAGDRACARPRPLVEASTRMPTLRHAVALFLPGGLVVAAALLRALHLRSRRYAIENEILIKAAPRVTCFVTVPVRTIYGTGPGHYRPFHDTWITSWLSVWYKTLDSEGS